jgi:hypothetical protein
MYQTQAERNQPASTLNDGIKVIDSRQYDRGGNRRLYPAGWERNPSQHRCTQGDRVGQRKYRYYADHMHHGRSKGRDRTPPPILPPYYRGQQQGHEEEQIVKSDPDMANAFPPVISELRPYTVKMGNELDVRPVRGENRCLYSVTMRLSAGSRCRSQFLSAMRSAFTG